MLFRKSPGKLWGSEKPRKALGPCKAPQNNKLTMSSVKIAPSILSADFGRLQEEIADVLSSGADLVHIDVMDGHFVPNITIGVPVVSSLAKVVDAPLDVHLMIENPEKYVGPFADALASALTEERGREISQDYIVVHAEACGAVDSGNVAEGSVEALLNCLKMIKARGIKAGFSVKPGTGIEQYEKVLPLTDMVLVMTVEPGFGGQEFMGDMMLKVEWLREKLENSQKNDRKLNFEIEVDGGINGETSKIAREAGANVLVAGNYVFKAKDRKNAILSLRG